MPFTHNPEDMPDDNRNCSGAPAKEIEMRCACGEEIYKNEKPLHDHDGFRICEFCHEDLQIDDKIL